MQETSDQPFLDWNMLFAPNMIHHSAEPAHASWMKGRDEPATWPRVTSMRLMFPPEVGFPWTFEVRARHHESGVTCGEVAQGISECLYRLTDQSDYDSSTPQKQAELALNYGNNRRMNPDVPGGSLGHGMRRLDWLGENSLFGGITGDRQTVRQVWGTDLPCTFVIMVTRRQRLSRDDLEDQERRREHASRREGRSRSRRRGPPSPIPPPPPPDSSSESEEEESESSEEEGHGTS